MKHNENARLELLTSPKEEYFDADIDKHVIIIKFKYAETKQELKFR